MHFYIYPTKIIRFHSKDTYHDLKVDDFTFILKDILFSKNYKLSIRGQKPCSSFVVGLILLMIADADDFRNLDLKYYKGLEQDPKFEHLE